MKEILERAEELKEGIQHLKKEIEQSTNIPDGLARGMLTDLAVSWHSIGMVPVLLKKNPKDALYYFSRACTLIGCAQGKLTGYRFARKEAP